MSGVHIAGVACPCGCPDLVVVVPGHAELSNPAQGVVEAGDEGRGWCSIEHARRDGWPWLPAARANRRRAG